MSLDSIYCWTCLVVGRSCAPFVAGLALVLVLGTPTSASLGPTACTEVLTTAADDDQVFAATASGSVIAVTVDQPGFLAVQAEIENDASAVAWVSLAPCRSRVSKVGGFFDRGLVAVREPGVVYLGVGLVDGSTPPADLRLSTRLFGPARAFEKDGEDGSDTEEEEDEILPLFWPGQGGRQQDGLAQISHQVRRETPEAPGDARQKLHSVTQADLPSVEEQNRLLTPQIQVHTVSQPKAGETCGLDSRLQRSASNKDGEDGSDTEEEEDEILPIQTPGGPWVIDCASGEPFDDLRLCAQPFERGVDINGRLDTNPYGRDLDYYTFTVASVEDVRILAEGPQGFTGTLLDARGRSLARRVIEDGQFTFDLVLVPGRYYVRTEGWSENDYRLKLEREITDR